MTSFCPYCGNILLIDNTNELQYFCTTCPYVFKITKPVYNEIPVKKKELDAVLDEETWKNAQKTDSVVCEKCGCHSAYFFQLQIRSADEPMTTFYRCANHKCSNQWKDG